jgi:hypothetical protein
MAMSVSGDRDRKQQIAWDPGTSADVLDELAEDPDPFVRAAAAQNATKPLPFRDPQAA